MQLFEDDGPLRVDVAGPQRSRPDDVGEDVDRVVELVVGNSDVERRHLLCREGVHVAADGLDSVGDLGRAALSGALEQQVLKEVTSAELGRLLVSGTDADPEADAHRPQGRERFRDDTKTRVEPRFTNVLPRRSGTGWACHQAYRLPPRPPRRRPPPPRPPPRPPLRSGRPTSAGPRSPNSSFAWLSQYCSKDTASFARPVPLPPSRSGARSRSRPRPPRADALGSPLPCCRSPDPPSERGGPLASSPSPTRDSDSLPWLSMSETRTSTSSPRFSTSSTRSMRRSPPSLAMCSSPSRPG